MRRWISAALSAAVVGGLVPASVSALDDVVCPEVEAPALAFEAPLFIDKSRAGGEPLSVVAQDGSISVSAHAGTTHVYKDPTSAAGAGDFAVGYTNQTLNWRSTDDGRTWQYVGIPMLREGPHSATSTGFSDPDFAIDAGGRIYNTEINLANVSVFSSLDDGQSYTVAHPEVTSGDRPWLTGGAADEVFLYVNTGQQIWRSTNGGVAWTLQTSDFTQQDATRNAALPNAKIYNDPRNFATGLIGPHGDNGITISADEGVTWKAYDGAGLGRNREFFDSVTIDKAGHAYKAAAGGYNGGSDTTPNGQVTFNYFDRDRMAWGDEAVEIPTPPGDAMWPWLVAGDDGRVAVTWLQSFAGKPNEFHVFVALTNNARGTNVECSDGSTRHVPPVFTVVNASQRPIHIGAICVDGTTCNANPSFTNGDRRMGDFITANFDKDGTLFVIGADTTLKSPTGGAKPVGNPIFLKATADSAKLLTTPMQVRPTRCLFPLPDC